jgi:HK97 family phage major capsid protein
MSTKLQALKQEREEAVAEMEAITDRADAEVRNVSEEEQKQFDELDAKCASLTQKIDAETVLLKHKSEVESGRIPPSMGRTVPAAKPAASSPTAMIGERISIPASVKRWTNLQSFKGPAADVKAYKAGQFYMACLGNQQAQNWLSDHGIDINAAAQREGINTSGGYLVYDELDNAIIDLRDTYGVFVRNARRVAMTSDVMNRPRRTGGLTVYFVNEDAAVTESNKEWDKVTLTARKAGCIARVSNELSEDAIINVADDLTKEIAWAFAKKIDDCGFIGDGTATYGGIHGISPRLIAVNGVDDGGGLVKSANNTYAEISRAELIKTISILPAYAQANAKWYCSTAVWGQSLLNMTAAGGGNTIASLEAGGSLRLLGYPVELTPSLPSTAANSQLIALFGDLSLSSDFGDRRQTTIKMSDSAVIGGVSTFERDEVGLIGTMRFDVNNHDIGTATAAGPVVGLILHSA